MTIRERTVRAAVTIVEARLAHTPLGRLADDRRPQDEPEGYAVQEEAHARLAAADLGAVAGYKIGCTTPVMQARLGIDHPCAGGVFATTVRHGVGRFRRADFVRPGIECEIAVRLGADLPPTAAPFDYDAVAATIDACMAAIEVVDYRYDDHAAVGVPTLIADDFFGAGCVLGPPLEDWRGLDLAAATATTAIDGVEVGRGHGADVMGHPFVAVAWLANTLAARGRTLNRGAFVLTGSIVAAHRLAAEDRVAVTSVDGLGSAEARFD